MVIDIWLYNTFNKKQTKGSWRLIGRDYRPNKENLFLFYSVVLLNLLLKGIFSVENSNLK